MAGHSIGNDEFRFIFIGLFLIYSNESLLMTSLLLNGKNAGVFLIFSDIIDVGVLRNITLCVLIMKSEGVL